MRKPIRYYNCFKVDFKSTHRHTGAIRNIEMNLYIGEKLVIIYKKIIHYIFTDLFFIFAFYIQESFTL